MLPPELVPESKKHVHMPCAQLYKSLYGHPESSAHWQAHLSRILHEKLNGVEFSEMPSVFRFGRSLVMSVYVDDLTLSGVASEHEGFCKALKQYINLDPPSEYRRVLGRNHMP